MYTELKKVTKLNDFAIAGIMANLFQESGFNPQAFNKNGNNCGAYGLAQWRGDRIQTLSDLSKSSNLKINDYKLQIKMLNNELSGLFKYTLNALKNVNSYQDATKIFYCTFEITTKGTLNFNVSNVLHPSSNKITLVNLIKYR